MLIINFLLVLIQVLVLVQTSVKCDLFLAVSHSSQCSTTGLTNAVVCVILSMGWCI